MDPNRRHPDTVKISRLFWLLLVVIFASRTLYLEREIVIVRSATRSILELCVKSQETCRNLHNMLPDK